MSPLERWHQVVSSRDSTQLDHLLAEDVTFHSPVVHTPQRGRAVTKMYLSAAMLVLGGPGFRYVREVVCERDAALEFVTEVDGIHINGVDLIRWNEDGQIEDFKVMIRPLKAIELVHGMMKQKLGG